MDHASHRRRLRLCIDVCVKEEIETISLIGTEIEEYASMLADSAPAIGSGQAKLIASLFARRWDQQEAA